MYNVQGCQTDKSRHIIVYNNNILFSSSPKIQYNIWPVSGYNAEKIHPVDPSG